MNQNPYAPPQAEVADVAEDQVLNDATIFFPCSLLKLGVMSFCTLGLYHIYWFYKNWQDVRWRTREDITPVARSIFSIFFCYGLFKRIREYQETISDKRLAAGPLATLFIFMNIASRLPGLLPLASLFSFIPLLVVQHAVNEINRVAVPDHDPNSKFTGWNWAFVALAVVGWTLVIIGVNSDSYGM